MERKKKQQEMRSEEWLNKMKEGRGRKRGTKEYKCVRQGEKGRCQRESKERGQKREEVYDWMIRRGYNGLVGRRRKRPKASWRRTRMRGRCRVWGIDESK